MGCRYRVVYFTLWISTVRKASNVDGLIIFLCLVVVLFIYLRNYFNSFMMLSHKVADIKSCQIGFSFLSIPTAYYILRNLCNLQYQKNFKVNSLKCPIVTDISDRMLADS